MAALSPPADAPLMSVRISVAAITAVGLLVALPSIILLQSSPRAAPSAEWERPAPCMSRRWDSKLSSENLQDVVLRDVFFPSLCAGTALEMGANDGRVGSPTLNFGRSGWRTVLIEADPIVFHTLRANRPPPEITINAVVSDEARTETWVRFDNRYLSGIKRFLNMEKLKPMLADGRLKVLDELPLEGLPLQTLLAQHGVPHVDLCQMVSHLNKLDVGLDARVMLSGMNEGSLLLASYRDLKAVLEQSFADVVNYRPPPPQEQEQEQPPE